MKTILYTTQTGNKIIRFFLLPTKIGNITAFCFVESNKGPIMFYLIFSLFYTQFNTLKMKKKHFVFVKIK